MTYQSNNTVVEGIQSWNTIQCKHVIMCLYTPTRVPAKTFEFAFILSILKDSGSLTKGKRHVRYFEQTKYLYNKTIHAAQIRWPILSSAPRNDESAANSRIGARFRADTIAAASHATGPHCVHVFRSPHRSSSVEAGPHLWREKWVRLFSRYTRALYKNKEKR